MAQGRFVGELTQSGQAYDGLRCNFLRQVYAAPVGRAVDIIEIKVGQLLRATKRSSLDPCDLRNFRVGGISVVQCQDKRRHGNWIKGCRWLLRARDLSGRDTLAFTQEFLGEMLGVRRNSVSLVAHTLQAAGMIKYSRGRIQILDVEALKATACECYATINRHYQACLGLMQGSV